jgi:hypothetical protein
VGDQCSIRRPIHRGQAVPRQAALLQVEQPPEARQGNPLAAQQAVAAARLAADTQQGRAARRQVAEVARQALHPKAGRLAETSALGRRRAHWGIRSGHSALVRCSRRCHARR